MSVHDLVTGCLVYLAIGSLLWSMLHASGLIDQVSHSWALRGRPIGRLAFSIAIVMVIVAWPRFVVAFVKSVVRGNQ
jgi:hypothetical protein